MGPVLQGGGQRTEDRGQGDNDISSFHFNEMTNQVVTHICVDKRIGYHVCHDVQSTAPSDQASIYNSGSLSSFVLCHDAM